MIQVSDVLSLVKNYSRNQNLSDSRGIQVINSAVNFVYSHLGMPSAETTYSFLFDQDQVFYDLPTALEEPISLRYQDDNLNKNADFVYNIAEKMFARVKLVGKATRIFGMYNANGKRQIMILATNSVSPMPIDTFDTANSTNWTANGDTTNIHDDQNTKEEGSASLAFDIAANVSNRASLIRTLVQAFDWTTQQGVGILKMYAYLPSITNFTNFALTWGSDNANYFKRTVTLQEDGSALVVGWNKLAFPWDSSVVQVGTPDLTNITYFKIDFDYGAGYSAPQYNFRVDYLRMVTPDPMYLTYYSRNKGHTAGGAPLEDFTALTDTFDFATFDTSFRELVALHAAVIVNPQILVNDEPVRKLYSEFYQLYSRKYPRKRKMNLLMDPITSRTTNE